MNILKKPIRLGPLHIETAEEDEPVAYVDLHIPKKGEECIYLIAKKAKSSWRFELSMYKNFPQPPLFKGKVWRFKKRLWMNLYMGINWPIGTFIDKGCDTYDLESVSIAVRRW